MPTRVPGSAVAHPASSQTPSGQRPPTRLGSRAKVARASAYDGSDEGNACTGFPQTQVTTLSIGTNLIPCGARMRICVKNRCVVAQRRDTGPFISGRTIDVNIGVAHALGFGGVYEWGVRNVRWERVKTPTRTVAGTARR